MTEATLLEKAEMYLKLCYSELDRESLYENRWLEVKKEIKEKGTYKLLELELNYGAKVAWRNSNKCIGRLFWRAMDVFDRRSVNSIDAIFESLFKHIDLATNRGNVKSMISVFFLICILKIQADESLFMYKKDSLIYVKQKKIFDSKIISEISTIRKNWRTKFFSKVIRMIFNLLLLLIPSLLIGQKVNIIIYNPFIYFSNKKIFLEIYNYIEKYKKY